MANSTTADLDGLTDIDFICVGGGLGGLSAAIFAHDRGLRPLIVEASPFLGGVGAYSAGSVWVAANHVQAAAGLGDTLEAAKDYLSYVGGDDEVADLDLRSAFLGAAPGVIAELARIVPFQMSGNSDQYYPWAPGSMARGRSLDMGFSGQLLGPWRELLRGSPYFPSTGVTTGEAIDRGLRGDELAQVAAERQREDYLTGGQGLMAALIWAALVARKIPLLLSTRVTGLDTDKGRVVGVRLAAVDGERGLRAAHGVLIATGGYGSAPFAAQLEGLPSFHDQSPPVLFGDGLSLAAAAGAIVTRAGLGFPSVGFPSTEHVHPGTDVPLYLTVVAAMSYPYSIVVNRDGERFADESIFGAFSAAMVRFDGKHKRFANLPCYFLADDRYRQSGNVVNGSRGRWPAADIVRADTLDELAMALGINANGLDAQVKRFNSFAASGIDEDFQRGSTPFTRTRQEARFPDLANPLIGGLIEPPFWGVRLEPVGTGVCSHGLRIDAQARVLNWAGTAIPGLYATGSALAFTELPFGYQDGIANSRNIVYGALAVQTAVGVE